jgi:hypothetical protein
VTWKNPIPYTANPPINMVRVTSARIMLPLEREKMRIKYPLFHIERTH